MVAQVVVAVEVFCRVQNIPWFQVTPMTSLLVLVEPEDLVVTEHQHIQQMVATHPSTR